jgi:antitoxin component YwqK of YwqJK toxin-antitoxin module
MTADGPLDPDLARERHPDGTPKAAGPLDAAGRRDGPWIFWHPGGDRWLAGSYRAGAREGPWSGWHRNGVLRSEGSYRAGRKHGPWRFWHANGFLAQEGSYADGLQDGPWRGWHADGTLRMEGVVCRGRKVGLEHLYEPGGRLVAVLTYEDGRVTHRLDSEIDTVSGIGDTTVDDDDPQK